MLPCHRLPLLRFVPCQFTPSAQPHPPSPRLLPPCAANPTDFGELTRITGCWDDKYEFHVWSNVVCVRRTHFMYPELEKMSSRYALCAPLPLCCGGRLGVGGQGCWGRGQGAGKQSGWVHHQRPATQRVHPLTPAPIAATGTLTTASPQRRPSPSEAPTSRPQPPQPPATAWLQTLHTVLSSVFCRRFTVFQSEVRHAQGWLALWGCCAPAVSLAAPISAVPHVPGWVWDSRTGHPSLPTDCKGAVPSRAPYGPPSAPRARCQANSPPRAFSALKQFAGG